ncbi:MAG: leucyl aminopeptidase [Sandaracinaceae bacterium]|nr:leucyl aminopeptidase [Sandaracinaceae bacterium]
MEVSFVVPDLRRLDELKSEAIALAFFEDERPLRGAMGLLDWRLCGALSRLILRGRASGALGETVLVATHGRLPCDKLFLFGCGASGDLDEGRFRAQVDRMLGVLDRARVRASVLGLPGRATDRVAPATAMQLFLEVAAAHTEHDQVVLLEDAESQRAMMPVVDRDRRRVRAFE